ncbi:MAG: DUF3943 domain-containing protein [Treponema sp.]|jgi:hypothetical protein|nr:DUF3943 domain-containing protein [Treponema sp.]
MFCFTNAAAEALFSNLVLIGITSFMFNFDWARPTPEIIRANFTDPWEWEAADGFKVNQLGHPYQGSIYFNAGRANGFSFYESFGFTALGSFTWEAFGEGQHAAINDFITTTIAAAPLGEMLHRLYLEADAAGVPAPLTFLISPMDGFNRLITGKHRYPAGGKLQAFSLTAGFGASSAAFSTSSGVAENIYSFYGPAAHVGLNVVYGDPFTQSSPVPYEHFEAAVSFGLNPGRYLDARVTSDGYLFSFSPDTTHALSTGLTLHYDFFSLGEFRMDDSTIDYFGTALDWTVKYHRALDHDWSAEVKAHAGSTFFGVSNYYAPDTAEATRKNYGGGVNTKLSFSLMHPKQGAFSLGLLGFCLWTYPGTSRLSSGTASWLFIDAAYTRPISPHVSLGLSTSFAAEIASYTASGTIPATKKHANCLTLVMTWSL